jgi:hypothetical protein
MLARWAGVGVLILAVEIVTSCGDEEYIAGPVGDPNPNEPYPLWVTTAARWFKYDQNGHNILSFEQMPGAVTLGINPATGDIWASAEGLSIYGPDGKLRKKAELSGVGLEEPVAFDTRRAVAWVCYYPEIFRYRLAQFDFEGKLLKDIAPPEGFAKYADMAVHEGSGEAWLISEVKLYKLNPNGEVIFERTREELGFNCEYLRSLTVDQTDGSVWLRGSKQGLPVPYIIRVDKNGQKTQELHGKSIACFDVGRKTGEILAFVMEGECKYARLYDKSGELLWESETAKSIAKGAINDYDGTAWIVYFDEPPVFKMAKINRSGEYLIRDVAINLRKGDEFDFEVKVDPYPYK